jgi:hypothetical protein
VHVGEIRHLDDGRWRPGRDPQRRSHMSFAEFADPDGDLWLLQEVRYAEDEDDR